MHRTARRPGRSQMRTPNQSKAWQDVRYATIIKVRYLQMRPQSQVTASTKRVDTSICCCMRLSRSVTRFSTRLAPSSTLLSAYRPLRPFMSTAPEAKASTSAVPQWYNPTSEDKGHVLKVNNSLTKRLTPFVPMNGKAVSFYNCGPTVYSNSHLGHARYVSLVRAGDRNLMSRNYTAQDLIRRALRDYFGYNVHFVMNITDIDDKVSYSCCIDSSKPTINRSLSNPAKNTSSKRPRPKIRASHRNCSKQSRPLLPSTSTPSSSNAFRTPSLPLLLQRHFSALQPSWNDMIMKLVWQRARRMMRSLKCTSTV